MSTEASTQLVHVELHQRIAVMTIANAPVNALSTAVRTQLHAAVMSVAQDLTVDAAVIIGAGKLFSAGAELREFDLPVASPSLPEVIAAIEMSSKPVVAAIAGSAFGGALELVLGCHARVVTPEVMLGLPEVSLGLIPGAGGTQRLLRWVRCSDAIQMVTRSKSITAQQALVMGLVDVVADELLPAALQLAGTLIGSNLDTRRAATRAIVDAASAPSALQAEREYWHQRAPGFAAPGIALDALANALQMPFAAALTCERELFLPLRTSAQAKALRHLFFAERQVRKLDAQLAAARTNHINKVGVIGAGTMGAGIAAACLLNDFDVVLVDASATALAAAPQRIAGFMKSKQADHTPALHRLSTSDSFEALRQVDLVIEAVYENLAAKQDVFREVERVVPAHALLASNTSYLDLDAIAAVVQAPERVVGLHFFAPAQVMKLLEVVRCTHTAATTLASAMQFAHRLGKTAVLARNAFGFIGNRLYQQYQREAGLLLLEGATPAQIDTALVQWGMALGPLATADLSGLDIGSAMRRSTDPLYYEPKAFIVHDRLVELGRKGRKAQAGFYDYGAMTGNSATVSKVIQQVAAQLGIAPRAITAEEIVERCVLAMVVEGARVLHEGVAARAADIDVVFTNGYGFPRYRGGPMDYAKTMGLNQVVKLAERLAQQHGDRWWTPNALLHTAAEHGDWPVDNA